MRIWIKSVTIEANPDEVFPPSTPRFVRVRVRVKAEGHMEHGLEKTEVIPVSDFDSLFSAMMGWMTTSMERTLREIDEGPPPDRPV